MLLRSGPITKRKFFASAAVLLVFMVSILLIIYNISPETRKHIISLPERITTEYLSKTFSTYQGNQGGRNSSNSTRSNTRMSWNLTRISASPKKIKKKGLLLFVGIHSAPSRLDRRNAIRETWMKECQSDSHSVCLFFTDGQEPDGKKLNRDTRITLQRENRSFGDLLLTEVPGGVNFAVKYLWMLQWAKTRYDFQYFLRLDDDYFICFHKLMLELEFFRPKTNFQWGWLHCDLSTATWLDEAFYLVSKDVVDSFLSRRDTLVCHVWESQAIGYWIKSMSNLTTFADNRRLLHTRTEQADGQRTEICHSFLAIHKSYPEKMRMFWRVYEKEEKPVAYPEVKITYGCRFPLAMDYRTWRKPSIWFSEPKLCKDNPIWNRNGEYKGRRGY